MKNLNVMKAKLLLINLVLYVYTNFIYEDWELLTKTGNFLLYPAWLVYAAAVILLSPIFALGYFWENSETYKQYQEAKAQVMLIMNEMYSKKQ